MFQNHDPKQVQGQPHHVGSGAASVVPRLEVNASEDASLDVPHPAGGNCPEPSLQSGVDEQMSTND
jgi:hypothetical protein